PAGNARASRVSSRSARAIATRASRGAAPSPPPDRSAPAARRAVSSAEGTSRPLPLVAGSCQRALPWLRSSGRTWLLPYRSESSALPVGGLEGRIAGGSASATGPELTSGAAGGRRARCAHGFAANAQPRGGARRPRRGDAGPRAPHRPGDAAIAALPRAIRAGRLRHGLLLG